MNDDDPIDIAALTALCPRSAAGLAELISFQERTARESSDGNEQRDRLNVHAEGVSALRLTRALQEELPELLRLLAAARERIETLETQINGQATNIRLSRGRIAALEADRNHARAWARWHATGSWFSGLDSPIELASDGWSGLYPAKPQTGSTSTAGGE